MDDKFTPSDEEWPEDAVAVLRDCMEIAQPPLDPRQLYLAGVPLAALVRVVPNDFLATPPLLRGGLH